MVGSQEAWAVPCAFLRAYQSCLLDRPSSQKAWAKCFLSNEAKIDIQACPLPAPAPMSPLSWGAANQPFLWPVPHADFPCFPHPSRCPALPAFLHSSSFLFCYSVGLGRDSSRCCGLAWDSPFLAGGWGGFLASLMGMEPHKALGPCSVLQLLGSRSLSTASFLADGHGLERERPRVLPGLQRQQGSCKVIRWPFYMCLGRSRGWGRPGGKGPEWPSLRLGLLFQPDLGHVALAGLLSLLPSHQSCANPGQRQPDARLPQ